MRCPKSPNALAFLLKTAGGLSWLGEFSAPLLPWYNLTAPSLGDQLKW